MQYVIGVDLGTSATKTILMDAQGRVLCAAAKSYPMFQPDNGWAEQDPRDWKNAALETIKEVVETSGVDPVMVRGIGLSGQMHGLVMLDENNELIRNSIIWCDQRAGEQTEEMLRILPMETWMEITSNPPLAGWTAAKILWVREHEPELYEKCRHIMLPKDYVRFILTGRYGADVSDGSGMQLMDVKNRVWSASILKALQIDPELLGPLYESCEIVGPLLTEIAKKVGLTEETLVAAGASDNACAGVGTGIVKEGQAFTSIGTSAIVYTHLDEYRPVPGGGLHLCCCAVPGCWHTMGGPQSAGLSVEWFREKFCGDLMLQAKEKNKDFFELAGEMIKEVPAGSDRLIYLPFLMGERTPHMNAWYRGSLVGLNVIHGQGHVLRAIMEGVAYCLEDCRDLLKEQGVPSDLMRICGGGSKSAVWREILGAVFACDLHTLQQEEGPAYGAAILAGVGAGLFPSVQEACEKLIAEKETIPYQREMAEHYRRYHRIYDRIYESLKDDLYDLYHAGDEGQ